MGTIVILGSGRVGRLEALTLIEDWMDGQTGEKEWHLLFPLLTNKNDSVTPIIAQTYRWSLNKDNIDHSVLVNSEDTKSGDLVSQMVADAAESFEVKDPIARAIAVLDPEKDVVILAWDDEDFACEKALKAATRRGIRVLDLTFGLTNIVWAEDQEAAPAPAPEEAPPWTPEPKQEQSPETSEGEQTDYERIRDALEPFIELVADLVLARMEEKLSQ